MMGTLIDAETAKLAGLQIDMMQKLRDNQLTLEQIEWWNNLSKETRERYMQADFRDVARGMAKIVPIEHIIDCDADPFLPDGWRVKSHKKDGLFKWDASNVKLYRSKNQKDGQRILGYKLCEELANEPVLNANVLDYLLAHHELIPGWWKGQAIFFWGTIYINSGDNLCVRYLCWYDERWCWDCRSLGGSFHGSNPALLRAA